MKWSVSFWKTFCKCILSHTMSWLYHVHLTFVTLAQYFLRFVFENMNIFVIQKLLYFELITDVLPPKLNLKYIGYVLSCQVCHVTQHIFIIDTYSSCWNIFCKGNQNGRSRQRNQDQDEEDKDCRRRRFGKSKKKK